MIELIITRGDREQRVLMKPGEWVLGRSSSADIQIDDAKISRKHLSLSVSEKNVRVVNLGRYGTLLDGAPVTEAVEWSLGAVLTLSKDISLRWGLVGDSKKELAGQPVSGGASQRASSTSGVTEGNGLTLHTCSDVTEIELSTGKESISKTRADGNTSQETSAMDGASHPSVDLPTHGDADPGTYAGSADELPDDEWGKTRELHTRVAFDADIEKLRAINFKSRKKRVWGYTTASVLVLALVVFLYPRKRPPEVSIEWPQDAAGNSLESEFEAPNGGFKVIVPDLSARIIRDEPGVKLVQASVGRDRNVPLNVWVEEVEVSEYWKYSLQDLTERWMSTQSKGASWLFDDPLSSAMFLGGRSGVPFVFVRYTRTENEIAWAGTARFIRSGARFSVVRTEVPLNVRSMTSELLSYYYISLTDDFIDRCWEPVILNPSGSASVRLQEAKQMGFDRDNPAYWPEVIRLLREALTIAAREGDMLTLTEAGNLLVEFRGKQQRFYNGQSIAFDAAKQRGDDPQASAIQRLCTGVFSEPDDARFYQVRRWEVSK